MYIYPYINLQIIPLSLSRGLRLKQSGPWSGLGRWMCAEDGGRESAGTVKRSTQLKLSHPYDAFTLVDVYYSSGKTITWNINSVMMYFFLQTWKSYLAGKVNELSYLLYTYSGCCVFIWLVQKLTGILTMLRCIFPQISEILHWIDGDLSRGQT